MGLEGFWLLSSSIVTVIEGVYVFLNVAGNCRCAKVFKLLVHLGVGAHSAILPKGLYYCNLSLSEGPSCLSAMAVHKVFIEFPFRLLRDFKGGW